MLWFQDKIVVFVRVQDFDNRSSVAGPVSPKRPARRKVSV